VEFLIFIPLVQKKIVVLYCIVLTLHQIEISQLVTRRITPLPCSFIIAFNFFYHSYVATIYRHCYICDFPTRYIYWVG